MNRPSDVRLFAMVQYIRSLGLQVYGPSTDLRSGEQGPGCQDFTPRQVVTYRYLKEEKKLHTITAHEMLRRERAIQLIEHEKTAAQVRRERAEIR